MSRPVLDYNLSFNYFTTYFCLPYKFRLSRGYLGYLAGSLFTKATIKYRVELEMLKYK